MRKDYKLRSVNTRFWDDPYVQNLDPIEKLLFLYYITNPLTNLAGIYEITLKRMAGDTGIDGDMIKKILDRFERDDKIYYRFNYIILANHYKHQNYNDSMMINAKKWIEQLPKEVFDFIETLKNEPVYTLYTACVQGEGESEGEIEIEEEENKGNPLQPLFAIWGVAPDLGESMEVSNLIKSHGYEKVKRAFHTASVRKIKTVAYVIGILNSPERNKTSKKEERKIGS